MRPDFLGLFIIGILVMAFVYSKYPLLTRESFQNIEHYPSNQLCTMPLTTAIAELSGPADVTLNREPYHLLGDYLEPAGERLANLKSECAYVVDGQKQIERTGSYGQITNNYKKTHPDNGSTLLRELSLSFYK